MKRYDRRTFLKLSGASAVMLALSACEDEGFGGSGTPGTPAAPSPPLPTTPFTVGRSPPLARRFRKLPIRPPFR